MIELRRGRRSFTAYVPRGARLRIPKVRQSEEAQDSAGRAGLTLCDVDKPWLRRPRTRWALATRHGIGKGAIVRGRANIGDICAISRTRITCWAAAASRRTFEWRVSSWEAHRGHHRPNLHHEIPHGSNGGPTRSGRAVVAGKAGPGPGGCARCKLAIRPLRACLRRDAALLPGWNPVDRNIFLYSSEAERARAA